MNIIKLSDSLSEIDEKVRIESGPVRKKIVATAENLGEEGVFASHYQIGGVDSMGKVIEEGKEFDYIDWNGDGLAFYVYKKDEAGKWLKVGVKDSYEEALGVAITHLGEDE